MRGCLIRSTHFALLNIGCFVIPGNVSIAYSELARAAPRPRKARLLSSGVAFDVVDKNLPHPLRTLFSPSYLLRLVFPISCLPCLPCIAPGLPTTSDLMPTEALSITVQSSQHHVDAFLTNKQAPYSGDRTLEVLRVTQVLEGNGIPCCLVGTSALIYYGADRARDVSLVSLLQTNAK